MGNSPKPETAGSVGEHARERCVMGALAAALRAVMPLAAHEVESLKNDRHLDEESQEDARQADQAMSDAEAVLGSYDDLVSSSSAAHPWKYDATPAGAVIVDTEGFTIVELAVPGADTARAVTLAIQIVREHNAIEGVFAEKIGVDAAGLLLHAYARAKARGGSVDWDDLNRAFELALAEYPGRYDQLLELYDDGGDD